MPTSSPVVAAAGGLCGEPRTETGGADPAAWATRGDTSLLRELRTAALESGLADAERRRRTAQMSSILDRMVGRNPTRSSCSLADALTATRERSEAITSEDAKVDRASAAVSKWRRLLDTWAYLAGNT